MSSVAFDLKSVKGFMVADAQGRYVGHVEAPMYGTQPDVPDALAVRSGLLRRRRLVPADVIGAIDERTRVIGLSVVRESIRKFL
ncbi:MAG: hypothetical protein H0V68_02260 [Actinobacteria bacterium]|nr:hypothetical protein [Actinomycetota bacterium]